ncbi:MAG TPA: hypothetical protein VIH52_00270 [Candidatus Nanoarchaeia archaeon]
MKPVFIGIAGGTGSGKSTLCTTLQDKYPDEIGLIQLDDYFKLSAEVPQFEGHTNWDHPNALYLDKLATDLFKLSQGKPVIINTKNERLNPNYKKTNKRIPIEFQPKPIMLVEGYLVLWDKQIRNLLNTSIWLEASHDTRWKRRLHFKYLEYEKNVLIPMYKQFAEPTKQYANHIINVSNLTKEQVFKVVSGIISQVTTSKI